MIQDQPDIDQLPARKGMAITSLVLGIISIPTLGLCLVGGITGIVLGAVALKRTNASPERYAGKGLALGGIITSIISLLIAIPGSILTAVAIPNLLVSQQAARETAAIVEVKTIGKAQALYSATKGQGSYTNLQTLGAEGLIDSALASGEKAGYQYTSEPVLSAGSEPMFDTTARPVKVGRYGRGTRSFGSNETFVIYEAEGSVSLKGTPIDRVPRGGTSVE